MSDPAFTSEAKSSDARSGDASTSYTKTTLASAAVAAAALVLTVVAASLLPTAVAVVAAVLGALLACAAGAVALAGLVVLARVRRSAAGRPDLFLELNRSRNPAALEAATSPRVGRLRRRLMLRLAGSEFVVGDEVLVRDWDEIRATLDAQGCLDGMPFMPEMRALCGRRARVFRSVHRLFDYRKTRRMRHMRDAVLLVGAVCDGSSHGDCDAMCHTIWKSKWLRRVDPSRPVSSPVQIAGVCDAGTTPDAATVGADRSPARHRCQLTQLHAASRATPPWGTADIVLPVLSGNVAPAAFVVGCLTYLFNEAQHLRGGIEFPAAGQAPDCGTAEAGSSLDIDDIVVVRPHADILATLNERGMHRGLWFEPDMSKHCGQRRIVQKKVTRLVDIVSGELLTMRTPAYILRDVHFSGERQLFNAQYEPLFWRSIWLAREAGHAMPPGPSRSETGPT